MAPSNHWIANVHHPPMGSPAVEFGVDTEPKEPFEPFLASTELKIWDLMGIYQRNWGFGAWEMFCTWGF